MEFTKAGGTIVLELEMPPSPTRFTWYAAYGLPREPCGLGRSARDGEDLAGVDQVRVLDVVDAGDLLPGDAEPLADRTQGVAADDLVGLDNSRLCGLGLFGAVLCVGDRLVALHLRLCRLLVLADADGTLDVDVVQQSRQSPMGALS